MVYLLLDCGTILKFHGSNKSETNIKRMHPNCIELARWTFKMPDKEFALVNRHEKKGVE